MTPPLPLAASRSLHRTEGMHRPAWSLLEMVVVITVLSVLMVVVVSILTGAIRTEKAGAAALQKIINQSALADQFRGDVADADAAPENLGDFKKSPACLILHTAAGQVVYHWEKERLMRRVISGGKQKGEQQMPVGEKRSAVEFGWSKTGGRTLLTLRLRRGERPPLEIIAALGGNQR